MFSGFFIDRPIFASVLSTVITLAGVLALVNLPVAQYPEISPPSVSVSINYPGASAQVVADTVAAPIEQQVNGVPGMLYMSSQSGNDGSYSLSVTFEIGTDLNTALVIVQNRVTLAMPQLPSEVQLQGITIRKKTPDILQVINFTSPDGRYDIIYLSNFATVNVRDELLRIEGVSDINVFGQRDYSMRAWLDPQKLAARGIAASDVANALRAQNKEAAPGRVGLPPGGRGRGFQFPLDTRGRVVILLVAQIVEADEVPERAEVVPGALGERQGLAHEPGAPLPQGTPEALDVGREAGVLAHGSVPGRRDHHLVRGQEIGVHRDPGPVPARERLPQPPGGARGPVPDDHGQHPPGARVQGHPDPLHPVLGPDETPQLVGLDHDRADFLGAGPGSCGVCSRYTVLTNPWTHDRDRPVIRAMARTPTRSAKSRCTKARAASPTGPFLGAATNRRAQAWQRNTGVPEALAPFRTTWLPEHRGQGRIGAWLVTESLIRLK